MGDLSAVTVQTPPTVISSAVSIAGEATAGTRRYVRGSALLLGGRAIAIVTNLAVQVVTVRYLSMSDYGAFAYALGVASMGSSAIVAGLDKAVPRFLPIYQERGDQGRVIGVVALAAMIIWGLGISIMLAVFGFRDMLQARLVSDPHALALLLILIALAPLEAFGSMLQSVLAVFARARAIFFRRHIVGPGLKLAAVLLVVAVSGSVQLLAYGYVFGGAVGVLLYLSILRTVWREQAALHRSTRTRVTLPARELLRFSIPLLSSELLVIVRGFLAIGLLEFFLNSRAVAEYRAVVPIGRLNMLVFEAFALLFMPLAARMFARRDNGGIAELYWQTALTITVLTFPVFAVTFALSAPLTRLLFGAEYANSAAVLSVLALGYYFHAALGFNTAVLRVYHRVRYIMLMDALAVLFAVVSGIALIPRFGALGAAMSTTGTFVVHTLMNQIGLARAGIGIRFVDWRFTRLYAAITAVALLLVALQIVVGPPLAVGLGLAALASLLILRLCRGALNPAQHFPELLRIPLLRRLIA